MGTSGNCDGMVSRFLELCKSPHFLPNGGKEQEGEISMSGTIDGIRAAARQRRADSPLNGVGGQVTEPEPGNSLEGFITEFQKAYGRDYTIILVPKGEVRVI